MIHRAVSLLVIIAILGGIIAAGAGCAGDAALPPPEELIPEGSNLIGHIDWARIVEDKDFRSTYEETARGTDLPATAEGALDWVEAETKFVLEEFSQAWFFGDTTRMEGDNPYLGILAEGAFDKSEFVAAIAKQVQEELTLREYRGYQVYDAEGMAVAFLKADLLVFGSAAVVEDVIKVAEGEKESVSGPTYDLYASLGGVMLRVAGEIPPEAMQEFIREFGQEQLPFQIAGLDDLNAAGLALDKRGDTLSLQLVLSFANADSASQVSTTLQQLITMAGAMPAEEGVAATTLLMELLKKVQIGVQDNRVNIKFEMTLTEIKDLMQMVTRIESAVSGS